MNIQQIVVGVDFSANSRQALREAIHLRKDNHTGLAVVHILEEGVVADLSKHLEISAEKVREQGEERLQHWVDELAGPGHGITCEAVIGHPFEGIMHAVERHKADLLVLGSRGLEAASGHPGAVASKCIRKTRIDVMLVRRTQTGPFTRVVACIDFSEVSARTLALAKAVARTEGAVCEALHVHVPLVMGELALDPFPPVENLKLQSGREQAARDEFDSFLAVHGGPDVIPCFRVGASSTDGIVDYLRESSPDLAVLGTRGRTGLRAFLLGTTAERLIHEAPTSLLVTKEHPG